MRPQPEAQPSQPHAHRTQSRRIPGLCVALALLALPGPPAVARSRPKSAPTTLRVVGQPPVPAPPGWSPQNALGAPDAREGADDPKAWATRLADAGPEWLEVTFGAPIDAQALHLHQTFNPGAVTRIEAQTPNGPVALWSGAEASKATLWRLNLPKPFLIDRVRIHLDTRRVAGWNEIDALGLLDATGRMHWATAATASTWYGDGGAEPGAPQGWTSLQGRRVRLSLSHSQVVGILAHDDGEFLEIHREGLSPIWVNRTAVHTLESLEETAPAP